MKEDITTPVQTLTINMFMFLEESKMQIRSTQTLLKEFSSQLVISQTLGPKLLAKKDILLKFNKYPQDKEQACVSFLKMR